MKSPEKMALCHCSKLPKYVGVTGRLNEGKLKDLEAFEELNETYTDVPLLKEHSVQYETIERKRSACYNPSVIYNK